MGASQEQKLKCEMLAFNRIMLCRSMLEKKLCTALCSEYQDSAEVVYDDLPEALERKSHSWSPRSPLSRTRYRTHK